MNDNSRLNLVNLHYKVNFHTIITTSSIIASSLAIIIIIILKELLSNRRAAKRRRTNDEVSRPRQFTPHFHNDLPGCSTWGQDTPRAWPGHGDPPRTQDPRSFIEMGPWTQPPLPLFDLLPPRPLRQENPEHSSQIVARVHANPGREDRDEEVAQTSGKQWK